MDGLGKIMDWFAKTWRERGIVGFYEAFNSWLAKRRERVIAYVQSSPDLPVLVILAVLIWIGWEVWNWLLLDLPTVSGDTPQGTGGADQQGKQIVFRSEVVRNMGLLIAAVIGLGFGIWRAYTAYRQTQASEIQARTAARGHFAERFAAAAEHLGHENLAVRLGGLYALAALGRDAEASDVVSIVDVICAFVRTGPPKKDQKQGGAEDTQPPERSGEDTGGKKITEDIQVALNILTYRQIGTHKQTGLREQLPEWHDLNLQGTDLRRANLSLANLSRADLVGANLWLAHLFAANLREANLRRANLSRANLTDADLGGANLSEANLSRANLTGAGLSGADLSQANLTGANLNGANLNGVNLSWADLYGANLYGANLSGAYLTGANLYGAKLREAKNLSQEQVDSAALSVFDTPLCLPEGLRPPTREYRPPGEMAYVSPY